MDEAIEQKLLVTLTLRYDFEFNKGKDWGARDDYKISELFFWIEIVRLKI